MTGEAQRISAALLARDDRASGELLYRTRPHKTPVLAGVLYTVLSDREVREVVQAELTEHHGGVRVQVEVRNNHRALHVTSLHHPNPDNSVTVDETQEIHVHPPEDRDLDRVRTLFIGHLPVGMVRPNPKYKLVNDQTLKKLELCYGVLGFMPPIVLDRDLQVIDGNLRLQVALKYARRSNASERTIPVVVLDDAGVRTDFLRLALNRLSEFQRWIYPEVDSYVDATPQAQPLLEPLGFFGERMLPATYFGDTVVNYSIDQYNQQQQEYKQEIGLAEWAEIQRERLGRTKASQELPPPPFDNTDWAWEDEQE